MPGSSLTLSQIAKRAYSERLPDDIDTGLEGTDFFRPPDFIYPFGTHIAVVEIERGTGIISLRDYYSVDDCGPRISPLLVAGQIHGGLAQGIGQALLEQVIYDEQGQLLTGTMMDYTMPRADDFPHFTLDQTVTENHAESPGRERHRRGCHHRLDSRRRQRRHGCAASAGRATYRHALDARTHFGKPMQSA